MPLSEEEDADMELEVGTWMAERAGRSGGRPPGGAVGAVDGR